MTDYVLGNLTLHTKYALTLLSRQLSLSLILKGGFYASYSITYPKFVSNYVYEPSNVS